MYLHSPGKKQQNKKPFQSYSLFLFPVCNSPSNLSELSWLCSLKLPPTPLISWQWGQLTRGSCDREELQRHSTCGQFWKKRNERSICQILPFIKSPFKNPLSLITLPFPHPQPLAVAILFSVSLRFSVLYVSVFCIPCKWNHALFVLLLQII